MSRGQGGGYDPELWWRKIPSLLLNFDSLAVAWSTQYQQRTRAYLGVVVYIGISGGGDN